MMNCHANHEAVGVSHFHVAQLSHTNLRQAQARLTFERMIGRISAYVTRTPFWPFPMSSLIIPFSLQNGHFSNQPGHFSNQPGHFSNQVGHFSNQAGHFSNQPGHFSNQIGHFPNQKGHILLSIFLFLLINKKHTFCMKQIYFFTRKREKKQKYVLSLHKAGQLLPLEA